MLQSIVFEAAANSNMLTCLNTIRSAMSSNGVINLKF